MIRILLADDFTIIRKGVRQILTQAYPNAEIEELEDGEEWADKLRDSPWDMIISDLPGPDRGGWEALQQIRQEYPDLPVLILSLYKENHAGQALESGAAGYMGRDAASDELIWAVGQILAGKKNLTVPSKDN
ncbi:response regulator transcription factor [Puia sp.]|jgi:DNA-binding NarL/FixJ family response regulator|uniref:response regulator n=1 Tax=Puia sp. TaxID=2045100 RepID=UPI002F41478D